MSYNRTGLVEHLLASPNDKVADTRSFLLAWIWLVVDDHDK